MYVWSIKDFDQSLRWLHNGLTSFLYSIFESITLEHATNLSGISVTLNGAKTSIFAQPQTIFDIYGMYAYPLSFFGAICFTIVQFMDININTLVANKNI